MTLGFTRPRTTSQPGEGARIALAPRDLDRLMPMHLWLAEDGRVAHAGPTIAKMLGDHPLEGMPLLTILEIRRPASVTCFDDLLQQEGQRLALALHAAPHLPMRGVLSRLPERSGALLDMSLGLSFMRGVAEFDLSQADFSPCDQTLELLYLHEANASIARLSRQLTERLRAARLAAEAQALTDDLTGLANRRAMDIELARSLADASADFALLHLDLDLFKQVNDTHGHAAGDRVLQQVGRILRDELRRGDIAARVGGDEFLVILRDCTDPDAIDEVASRLIARVEEPIPFDGVTCHVSASIGMASTAQYARRPSPDQLQMDTDMALYRAKHAGRGRHARHDDGGLPSPDRRASAPAEDRAGGGRHAAATDPRIKPAAT
ncbi:hypothetical protein roselon_00030 [Roseibacterium elongatum DSM 19469]|uniref:GGDEF domain-containing protein n=1 Tax=Roseicyclus elongatus DSM 19469 TaxID=1294273 RepID=W8RXH0_9RHOB|nr:diguanylate cyclase [Roseibacterium elongatum]AHM02497.1 hypothetical protein roselon_00030 [Roseibacterium elongatum DSM 19469]